MQDQTINAENTLNHVNALRWEHRLIIVHLDQNEEPYLTQFEAAQDSIEERHIIWFVLTPQHIFSNWPGPIHSEFRESLVSRYSGKPPTVLLVGKDTGIKNKSKTLDLENLFRQIDSMPMRIQEMGR